MAQGLLARFYIDAVEDKSQTAEEGRPIFTDVEFVEIIPIGDTKTKVVKRATDEQRQKFAEEYAVFKKGVEQTFSGTPLNQWPIITPALIKQFNHFNVYTVDQLAELNDIAINQIGPGTRDWVQKAKAFLAKAKSTAEAQKFAVENERLKEELARQQAIISDLAAKVEKLSDGSEPKRGPGRPRKEEQAEAAA